MPASSKASFFKLSKMEIPTGCPPANKLSKYPGKSSSFWIFLRNEKLLYFFLGSMHFHEFHIVANLKLKVVSYLSQKYYLFQMAFCDKNQVLVLKN